MRSRWACFYSVLYISYLIFSACNVHFCGFLSGWQQVMNVISVNLFAVVQARNIPGMSTNDVSCPFVSVELCPLTMFPGTAPHQTPVRTSTVNPVYEQKFELWAWILILPGSRLYVYYVSLKKLKCTPSSYDTTCDVTCNMGSHCDPILQVTSQVVS